MLLQNGRQGRLKGRERWAALSVNLSEPRASDLPFLTAAPWTGSETGAAEQDFLGGPHTGSPSAGDGGGQEWPGMNLPASSSLEPQELTGLFRE